MRVRLRDGTRLFVEVEGMGLVIDGKQMQERPCLVLLHGGQVDHSWFRPGFSRLAEAAQLIYMDRRGGGRSDLSTPERWNLTQWAEDVFETCDVLGIDHPVVLGSSLGGTVAMAYASRYPDHPAGLILASTTARPEGQAGIEVFRDLGGDEAAEAAASFYARPSPETEEAFVRFCAPLATKFRWDPDELARMRYSLDSTQHWVEHEAKTYDLLGDLSRVRCPVLLISGLDDPQAPPSGMRAIAEALPPGLADLRTFPGAGHGVCRDDPEGFFAAVEDFLGRIGTAGSRQHPTPSNQFFAAYSPHSFWNQS